MDIITAILGAKMAQNDLKANGQIGYTETSAPVVIIPEGSYEFANGEYGVEATQFPNVGDLVTLTLDGVVYSGAAKEAYSEGATVIYIGNGVAFGGVDTGETYVLAFISDVGMCALILLDGSSGTHTVELSFVTEIVRTIAPQYTAPMVVDMDDVIGAQYRGETPVSTFDQDRLDAFLTGFKCHSMVLTFKYDDVNGGTTYDEFCPVVMYSVMSYPDSVAKTYSVSVEHNTTRVVSVSLPGDGSHVVSVL